MIGRHPETKLMGWEAGSRQSYSPVVLGPAERARDIICPFSSLSMNLLGRITVSRSPSMPYDVSPWEVHLESFPQMLQNDWFFGLSINN